MSMIEPNQVTFDVVDPRTVEGRQMCMIFAAQCGMAIDRMIANMAEATKNHLPKMTVMVCPPIPPVS